MRVGCTAAGSGDRPEGSHFSRQSTARGICRNLLSSSIPGLTSVAPARAPPPLIKSEGPGYANQAPIDNQMADGHSTRLVTALIRHEWRAGYKGRSLGHITDNPAILPALIWSIGLAVLHRHYHIRTLLIGRCITSYLHS